LSERWWRRRRKKRPWFNDCFDEFDRLEGTTDEIIRKAFETASERTKARRPYVYGFSMSVGPDGNPVIRDFGNVQPSRRGTKIRKEREPLVDVIEEDKAIVIVAGLPGVEKDNIRIHAIEDHLTVSVNTHSHKYHKELALPARVDPKSVCVSYKNGVLVVRLKKLEAAVKDERISVKYF
jgi:HSP20 family protein